MNDLVIQLEALLFVATRPMTMKQIAAALDASAADVSSALDELCAMRNGENSGIHVVQSEEGIVLATNPSCAQVVQRLAKEDVDAELTRPSLETLTIIAYRGPITRPEIEMIRGVNCAIILRNLLMRGLITEEEDRMKLQPVYALSSDAVRHFGLHNVTELPEYASLHGDAKIDALLATMSDSAAV